jgi:cysteine desulfurase/selenocysteine lyase
VLFRSQQTDCDFYVFSGHKLYGPTGIGVLYAKEKWLEEMPPYQGGGDMVKTVSFEKTVYADLPFKFEAGTANYIGAVGLCVAVRFIKSLGIESLQKHENELLRYATEQLQNIGGVTIYGNASKKISTLSFLIDGVHHLDTAQILDKLGIAVRTGTLCAEPTMKRYDVSGMVRASFAFYNTMAEVDALADGIKRVKTMFG